MVFRFRIAGVTPSDFARISLASISIWAVVLVPPTIRAGPLSAVPEASVVLLRVTVPEKAASTAFSSTWRAKSSFPQSNTGTPAEMETSRVTSMAQSPAVSRNTYPSR